jgi:formylglycine-generating enzyme required for sulfatase activity
VEKERSLTADAEEWLAASDEQRNDVLARLLEQLGDDWRASKKQPGALRHRPTKLDFALVPGGSLRMGLDEAEIRSAEARLEWTDDAEELLERCRASARPVHEVRIAPFLCATVCLTSKKIRRLSEERLESQSLKRAEATGLAASLGFRLPSEAELEWLMRDGRGLAFTLDGPAFGAEEEPASRFGVFDLFASQWAADDWHPSYEGAPSTSEPWMNGDANGVYRGLGVMLPVDDESELWGTLAGLRHYGKVPSPDDGRLVTPDVAARFVKPLS